VATVSSWYGPALRNTILGKLDMSEAKMALLGADFEFDPECSNGDFLSGLELSCGSWPYYARAAVPFGPWYWDPEIDRGHLFRPIYTGTPDFYVNFPALGQDVEGWVTDRRVYAAVLIGSLPTEAVVPVAAWWNTAGIYISNDPATWNLGMYFQGNGRVLAIEMD